MPRKSLVLVLAAVLSVGSTFIKAQIGFKAADPGVRSGAAGAGGPIAGLTANQLMYFEAGKEEFDESETVDEGLGPTMNLDSCVGCHAQPASGGSSPTTNPQVAFATALGANNLLPSFIRADGPVREARFIRTADGAPDGGVHALFSIAGRTDARGCKLPQPDFATEMANHNVIFRIPTPTFGLGLIEEIPDADLRANAASNASVKAQLGIFGRPNLIPTGQAISGQPNRNGNDGTIARFGWKAQNKSLLIFSGEAYNVEMGVSNEAFPTERDETAGCQYSTAPNSITDTEAEGTGALSAIEKFAMFMRFLAPPQPSATAPGSSKSIDNGRTLFTNVGCALCHTPSFTTGNNPAVAALRRQNVPLYSDLIVHDMGPLLADGVTQGLAGPREFRTAPLWGLGQRVFFLHDGRTKDLLRAIEMHAGGSDATSDASEANKVIQLFQGLTESQKQDVLNFLRSL